MFPNKILSQQIAKINIHSAVTSKENTLHSINKHTMIDSVKKILETLEKSGPALFKVNSVLNLQHKLDSLKKTINEDTIHLGKDSIQENIISATCSKIEMITNLVLEKDGNGNYQFSLTDIKENPIKTFLIKQFNEELFKNKLYNTILSICDSPDEETKEKVKNIVETLLKQGLYSRLLEASLDVRSDDALAGKLRIFKTVEVSYYKDIVDSSNNSGDGKGGPDKKLHKREFIDPPFTVYNIQIQFQDGFIENIKVKGKMRGMDSMLLFANPFPFPFSSKTNFQSNRKLYEVTVLRNSNCILHLGELLQFDYELRNYTRDYFPENQVYKSELNDSITTVSLYKEKTTKILELRIFSDLKGIETDNPNGLIQTEFSKSFNFSTNRIDCGRKFNFGYLNYFTPEFAINKIEDNHKQLILDHFEKNPANTSKPTSFASTLDIYRHQIYNLGFSVNLILADAPELKSTINLCAGVYFGRSAIQDTLRVIDAPSNTYKPSSENNVVNTGVNTIQIVPELKWQIFPDERYGVTLSQKLRHFKILSNDFQQVKNKEEYISFIQSNQPEKVYNTSKIIWNSEICAFFKPSSNNQLFIRYRINYDLGDMNHNFSQLQIGLATFLTTTKKTSKETEKN
ncbi:hypothetical protein SAMN05518672_11567 [Chitinophaga sp. CF118]|nr:hypothetical protein SAMN05518672_11567 [Chitinophaga sp. CF118]